jgi:hypothetical protein
MAMKRILVGVVLISLAVSHCPSSLAQETADPRSAVQEELRKFKEAGIPTTVEELDLPDVADEENGASLYRDAFELLRSLSARYEADWRYLPYQGNVDWDQLDAGRRKRITDLVLHNADFVKLYRLLEEASTMPCCFFTEDDYRRDPRAFSTRRFYHLDRSRDCARFLATKAKIEVENGQVDDALRTILTNLRTIKRLCDQPFILSVMVRLNFDSIIVEDLEYVLNQGQGTVKTYESLIEEIREERKRHITQNGLRGEIAVITLPWFAQVRQGDIALAVDHIRGLRYSQSALGEDRKDQTLAMKTVLEEGPYRYWYREELIYLQAMAGTFRDVGKEPWQRGPEVYRVGRMLEDLPRGRGLVIRAVRRTYTRTHRSEASLDAMLGNAEIALALRIYKARNGIYPTYLASLVPWVVPELPKDPYTGKDHFYSPKEGAILIYSAGWNRTDDSGVNEQESGWGHRYDDIVWKLRNL